MSATAKSIPSVLEFQQIARIPAPTDNAAIALKTIRAGEKVLLRHIVYEMAHTVLEGHRFAVHRIEKGCHLLSWGRPFGVALRPIEAGEYLCNAKILHALSERKMGLQLPQNPNFADYTAPFRVENAGVDTSQMASGKVATFRGFVRPGDRGAGTRNYVVLLGTNSINGPFVRTLSEVFANVATQFPNIDGVVPVAHTEGGAGIVPNNLELTLRTLAGFATNPNVGAILAVDSGENVLSNFVLKNFCERHNYPLDALPHHFFTRSGDFETDQQNCRKIIERWLSPVNAFRRQEIPLQHLKIGLQCGGSDAFSGITANPLLGIMARETIKLGGSANLAETDELIGAESFVLEKVRNQETAGLFMEKIERFQKWAALHGQSAEGNPSGGNLFRGLYNISLKSLGAARKKAPESRLDFVIDYGEPMKEAGFYFMDSPGNDLESIAGQVAAGCNLILFATGNGSITNFPFVPTIKVMTTTNRFQQLRKEMDFNAGRHLDGEPLEFLGREAFDQMLEIASGLETAGERSGHSQVQLWREWRKTDANQIHHKPQITSKPVENWQVLHAWDPLGSVELPPISHQKVALILPTSLCAGEIARMISKQLNASLYPKEMPNQMFTRAVTLPHTEGCGNSGGESEQLFVRTMVNYLRHPLVASALLLEHGCEKTHNDAFRNALQKMDVEEARFGFASVQADGGVEKVVNKAIDWFRHQKPRNLLNPKPFSLGIIGRDMPQNLLKALQLIAGNFARQRGAVVVPEQSELWRGLARDSVSLDFGEKFRGDGIFTMHAPTEDPIEVLTGLGATGVVLILQFVAGGTLPGNPLVPTIQIAPASGFPTNEDLTFDLLEGPEEIAHKLLEKISAIQTGLAIPNSWQTSNTAFQITRGYTGISL